MNSHDHLTSRQQELLDYLRAYHRRTGLIPSTREIQAHFSFASQTAAVSHLKALERKGVIQRLPGRARAVIFNGANSNDGLRQIPIYGTIPAGLPDANDPVAEGTLNLDPAMFQLHSANPVFALRVRGESMRDAHILPGDMAIMEQRPPRDGDVVAALIDGETTLKRLQHRSGKAYLKAENPDYPDLEPEETLTIQGVMIGLIRPPRRAA